MQGINAIEYMDIKIFFFYIDEGEGETMAQLMKIVNSIDSVIGTFVLTPGLLFTGLLFTFGLGFVQFKNFGAAFKQTFSGVFKSNKEKGSAGGTISSFQALATAIAAQIGTGNVAGVASAIMTGGAGAVFWMWVSALVGMSTIFAEACLAQVYRERKDGVLVGGPAYYIRKGVGKRSKGIAKFLAAFFAISIVFALGLVGNMVQSNSIASAVTVAIPGLPAIAVGIVLAVLAGLIFIGGIKRIGRFAELVVPIMAVLYVIASIIILITQRANIPSAFGLIFSSAFSTHAAVGGIVGTVVRTAVKRGVQRGLFSNEAGMGSTPNAHAVALVAHPAQQGLTAMIGVFLDTIVVCTATALTILLTQSYMVPNHDSPTGFYEAAQVTQKAFDIAFPSIGNGLLAICLTFFAFTTIVGWYYFGETNIRYLFGEKGLMPYRILVLVFIVLGSATKIQAVWDLSDFANDLMVIPNMIALWCLFGEVRAIYKDFNKCRKDGVIKYDYSEEAKP